MDIFKTVLLSAATFTLAGCLSNTSNNLQNDVKVAEKMIIQADATPIISFSGKEVNVKINFKNLSGNTIKYARFKVVAYDQNERVIQPKRGNSMSAYVRSAVQVEPGVQASKLWLNTWANPTIKCLIVDEVEVIMVDGSVELAKTGSGLKHNAEKICM